MVFNIVQPFTSSVYNFSKDVFHPFTSRAFLPFERIAVSIRFPVNHVLIMRLPVNANLSDTV